MPTYLDATHNKRNESNPIPASSDNSDKTNHEEFPLSLRSQQELKLLGEYVDHCRLMLNDIHTDLIQLRMDPSNPVILSKAAKRLGRFCQDADSWGFHSLDDVALGLQKLLLESFDRAVSIRLWMVLERGLNLLLDLVDSLEDDFRKGLAVKDVLESMNDAGRETRAFAR